MSAYSLFGGPIVPSLAFVDDQSQLSQDRLTELKQLRNLARAALNRRQVCVDHTHSIEGDEIEPNRTLLGVRKLGRRGGRGRGGVMIAQPPSAADAG